MPLRVKAQRLIATPSSARRRHRPSFRMLACVALVAALAGSAAAAPVSRDTALRAATGWLSRDAAPMGRAAGAPADVLTGSSDSGEPLFYAVNLAPVGFVIVAADDEVEPVLAFSTESPFLAETGTPLFDLLQRDARTRIAAVRQQGRIAAQPAPANVTSARAKWNALLTDRSRDVGPRDDGDIRLRGVNDVSDISVEPMVNSRWDQVSAVIPPTSPGAEPTELYIYNYYTPPFEPGNRYNYPAGCTAVAWAQIMRFHEWPKAIGAATYAIGIDWYGYWATTRGGDGAGGPYDWDNMPLDPGASTTPEQIRAIGGLMLDAGIGIGANFTWDGTYATADAVEMKNAFHYAEAKTILARPGLAQFMTALRTSLDAGLPANLDIFTESGIGHSLVVDGYGDAAGTRFYHLNLGWSGHNDAWYNFPPIDVVMGNGSPEFFTIISALKYNIDPVVAGEMITGRITDAEGKPVGGAIVTLNTTPAQSVTSNHRGIYAFKGLASNTAYTLSAAVAGYVIASTQSTVTTGDSAVEFETTANRIVDFNATAVSIAIASPEGMDVGAPIALSVSTIADAQPASWLRNGSPLADSASFSFEIASLQPANAGLYSLAMTNAAETVESSLALIGVDIAAKIAGEGREVLSNAFVASNGNTFDQILLEGAAVSVTADSSEHQITRLSYIDLNDDIVQVEFSGPGTLTLTLDAVSGPALPANYVQDVTYMKGHASIVITGATQDTNVSIFSVGKATAAVQTLFKPDVVYDGIADVAFIAIASRDGKFGGVRAANANFFAAKGVTGIYAPEVEIVGPLYMHNITAFDAAKPVIQVGSASDVRITGGDLYQENGDAIQVSGLDHVAFRDGTDSHGNLMLAKTNRGTLRENGTDVTTRLVVTPPLTAGLEPVHP